MKNDFWQGKRVLITGHTGFKGSWLSIWLTRRGALVAGYALTPESQPNLFVQANIETIVAGSTLSDIREQSNLSEFVSDFAPEIVFHLAAQSFVLESIAKPMDTFSINVMGLVKVFEALRECDTVRVLVNVTSDKSYYNQETDRAYHEDDRLGGKDPYSCSKACAELVTVAYRSSYFRKGNARTIGIATARAGNVIGGGDWSAGRLIPDCLFAMQAAEKVVIRNPKSIRPWQHVLDCLYGYMLLAERLHTEPEEFSQAFNFGPRGEDCRNVEWVVKELCSRWEHLPGYVILQAANSLEGQTLRLDSTKAKEKLGWFPLWNINQSLDKVSEWVKKVQSGSDPLEVCRTQIGEYEKALKSKVSLEANRVEVEVEVVK